MPKKHGTLALDVAPKENRWRAAWGTFLELVSRVWGRRSFEGETQQIVDEGVDALHAIAQKPRAETNAIVAQTQQSLENARKTRVETLVAEETLADDVSLKQAQAALAWAEVDDKRADTLLKVAQAAKAFQELGVSVEVQSMGDGGVQLNVAKRETLSASRGERRITTYEKAYNPDGLAYVISHELTIREIVANGIRLGASRALSPATDYKRMPRSSSARIRSLILSRAFSVLPSLEAAEQRTLRMRLVLDTDLWAALDPHSWANAVGAREPSDLEERVAAAVLPMLVRKAPGETKEQDLVPVVAVPTEMLGTTEQWGVTGAPQAVPPVQAPSRRKR